MVSTVQYVMTIGISMMCVISPHPCSSLSKMNYFQAHVVCRQLGYIRADAALTTITSPSDSFAFDDVYCMEKTTQHVVGRVQTKCFGHALDIQFMKPFYI